MLGFQTKLLDKYGQQTSRARSSSGALSGLLIFFSISASFPCAHAQQSPPGPAPDDTARGVKLFQQGEVLGAIEALRTATKYNREDAVAWHYLGLAYNRGGQTKRAREAFEKAVKLKPNSAEARTGLAYTLLLTNKTREAGREAERALALNSQSAEAHYVLASVRLREHESANALKEVEEALRLEPNLSQALHLKYLALISIFIAESMLVADLDVSKPPLRDRWKLLKEAGEALEQYLSLNPNIADAYVLREQIAILSVYADYANKSSAERTVFHPREVTTKPRILSRPEPHYTSEARSAQIMGKVVLLAVFGAEGRIQNVLILQALPYGLTKVAVEAARKIKFVPASKDGRPVSQFMQIEYNFNLY